MIAATGLKRLGLVVIALSVVGIGAVIVAPMLIPADTVREAAQAEIRSVTGLDFTVEGATTVSLFPSGAVSFDNVRLGDGASEAATLTAERVVARLQFLPLLRGQVEIADLSVIRPTIALQVGGNTRASWTPHTDALMRALRPPSGENPFSEIRITEGTVLVRDDKRQLLETLSRVDLTLAWPSISKSFGATGRFVWRGETVDAAVSLGDFLAALSGERSGLKLRLAGAPIKFAFDGYMSTQPSLKIDGKLATDAPSLREALRWSGQRPPPGGGFGRFALKADTAINGTTVALSGVNLELDGNVAEGVLTFSDGERRSLQGTLATDKLDLSPYISTVRLLTSGERIWNRLPITLVGLDGSDADLRISAATVTAGSAKLGRTAIGTHLRKGDLTVSIGEAQAYGGIIQGSFGLAEAGSNTSLKAHLQFTGVSLERCLDELFGIRRFEGTGNLGLVLESQGDSIFGLARAMNGTAHLTARDGALTGLNVEQLLRRLERRPLSGGGEFRTGRTPFDNARIGIRIENGEAAVEEVRIEGPTVRVEMAGVGSIPQRDIDMKGTASLVAGAKTGFALPFVVQGPWDDPIMLPDTDSLIRRSGAAAPLLEAVRKRRATDTVRSVLGRITGTAETATPPADGLAPAPAATAAQPATANP